MDSSLSGFHVSCHSIPLQPCGGVAVKTLFNPACQSASFGPLGGQMQNSCAHPSFDCSWSTAPVSAQNRESPQRIAVQHTRKPLFSSLQGRVVRHFKLGHKICLRHISLRPDSRAACSLRRQKLQLFWEQLRLSSKKRKKAKSQRINSSLI